MVLIGAVVMTQGKAVGLLVQAAMVQPMVAQCWLTCGLHCTGYT